VSAIAPLVSGQLTIEPRQDLAAGGPIELFFRGKSIERHPARTVVPYVAEILAVAVSESRAVRLHFETIEHMNSSTITAVIQIVQEARNRGARLVIVFDAGKNWQKLSFEALSVFVKGDGGFELVGERAS